MRVQATGWEASRRGLGSAAKTLKMMSRSFVLGAHKTAGINSLRVSTSHGLAGPDMQGLLLLVPEPKRCGRALSVCQEQGLTALSARRYHGTSPSNADRAQRVVGRSPELRCSHTLHHG